MGAAAMNLPARLVVQNIRKLRALVVRWGATPAPLSMRDIRASYRAWRATVGTWQ